MVKKERGMLRAARVNARGAEVLLRAAMVLLLAAVCASGAAAQSYKVEKFESEPPAELSAEVRATLAPSALRVRDAESVLCEIWLRREVPENPQREQSLGIAYGELPSGALIGAVKFHRKAGDYRRQSNPPGVYTWRYALLPSDGNHMGVAPNRDFLMLAPASEDKNPKNVELNALMDMSRKASGTTHPSVWSLTAAAGEHATVPAIAHEEEENLWVLFVNLPVRAQSGTVKQVLLAIVLVGAAPEA